jgi:uncharacterized protein (TIGR04255 family)
MPVDIGDVKGHPVSEQPYQQPPITEAVIEIRFSEPMPTADLAKVSDTFKSTYPHEQIVTDVSVQLYFRHDTQNTAQAKAIEKRGHRRSSPDQTELVLLWPAIFVVSQLAPYPGWDVFFARFQRDWNTWKRAVSYKNISRIGVRYINRIDIPVEGRPVTHEEEFLNVYVHMPDELQPLAAWAVQGQLRLPDIGCKLTLNSSVVPSPLLGHVAFVLDQDIAKDDRPPQNDAEIYELINQIRDKKNSVFESCITDKARRLFKP